MTDVFSVPQWFQGFGDLHSLIAETLRSPSPGAIRRLRQGIETYRSLFIQLLDDPPKNQEHRNTINSGQQRFKVYAMVEGEVVLTCT
jgi:hypothetical protein